MRIIVFLFVLFPGLLSAQLLKKLRIKLIQNELDVSSIRICGNPQKNYLMLSTPLRNLKFDISEYKILKIDSTSVDGYFLCIEGDKSRTIALTISSPRHKTIIQQVVLKKKYDISSGIDIREHLKRAFHSRNNYFSLEFGKGSSYSFDGGGLGMSVNYRLGEKVGWGLRLSGGYYSISTHGNSTMYFPHFSFGLKNYPFLESRKDADFSFSFVRGLYGEISYGVLGSEELSTYNNIDGSFSLGGVKTRYGVSMMIGDDFLIPINKEKTNGLIINGSIGMAYSVNFKKWLLAYDIGIGCFWKLNRK